MHLQSTASSSYRRDFDYIIRCLCAFLLGAFFVAGGYRATAAEETLDTVEKKVQDAWDKVNSYTATMSYEASMTKLMMTITTKGTGPFEFMKIDGAPRYRSEITNKMDVGLALPDNMATQTVLTVFDGTTMFSEMKAMGQTKVFKRKADPTNLRNAEGGGTLIQKMRAKGPVKLLPEEQVGSVPAYVFEVKASAETQKGSPIVIDSSRIYLAKDTGIQIKAVSLDAAQKPIATVTYSDIKVNPKLDPARFTYTPPPGVTVEEGWEPKSGGPAL